MKKILIFASLLVALTSCNDAAVQEQPKEFYFDREVSRLYNDPQAEMDTLSYATGMNLGLVLSLQNADFDIDTEQFISKLDAELKSVTTNADAFEQSNQYLTDFASQRIRPYMFAKQANARVVTERPDTLTLPALYDEEFTMDKFVSAFTCVVSDSMRKQRLPVNLHWVYKAIRDAAVIESEAEVDSVMALTMQEFRTTLADYTYNELPAYNAEIANQWYERVSQQHDVEVLLNANGAPKGVYYRIDNVGGEVKPVNTTDSIAVKYEVYSRTGQLLESNELFITNLKKQREQLANNTMMPDSMRNVYMQQIDREIENSVVRTLPLAQFMQPGVQEVLKLIGEGGAVTMWMGADKAFGHRASRILPLNEGVVVYVELLSVETILPKPQPISGRMMTVPQQNRPAKASQKFSQPTIVPVQ